VHCAARNDAATAAVADFARVFGADLADEVLRAADKPFLLVLVAAVADDGVSELVDGAKGLGHLGRDVLVEVRVKALDEVASVVAGSGPGTFGGCGGH